MNLFLPIFLTVVLAASCVTDLRSQRIPNLLTFPAAITALCYHGLTQGLDGLLFSLAGLGLGLAVMLLPYIFGIMGAGDVKLLAAVGAALGAHGVLWAFLFTSLAGGIYALALLAWRPKLLKALLVSLWTSLSSLLISRSVSGALATDQRMPRLCYGVAIAAGSIAAMLVPILEIPGPWAG